jgi:adenosylcobinamide-GDP ribazoletransferase
MSRQLRLLCVATQFLTRLPTPRLREFDPSWLSQSARYFPLIGVLIGALNLLVWWLASRRQPASVAIGLMMGISMLLTGAFHEDGFADTCDGLGGGGSRERVLAIMKDSRIGAFGAIGLVLMLGLKWTTLAA